MLIAEARRLQWLSYLYRMTEKKIKEPCARRKRRKAPKKKLKVEENNMKNSWKKLNKHEENKKVHHGSERK